MTPTSERDSALGNKLSPVSQCREFVTASTIEEAISCYEKLLFDFPDNADVLTDLGNLYVQAGRFSAGSHELLKRAAKLLKNNPQTLRNYAAALAHEGKYQEAFALFEQSLALDENDFFTLMTYGKSLVEAEQFEYAYTIFQLAVATNPQDPIGRFWYAGLLEKLEQYERAIFEFETIRTYSLSDTFYNLVSLKLASLYYLIHDKQKGNRCFEDAIAKSKNKEIEKLKVIRNILELDPRSDEPVMLLKDLSEQADSDFAKRQAGKMLAGLTDMRDYFDRFADGSQQPHDIAIVNRSIYHKIQNEIVLLKGIIYELIRGTGESNKKFLQQLIESIETITDLISERRQTETEVIRKISATDFSAILDAIASTAHDISDTVNNEIAIIKSDILFELRKGSSQDNSTLYQDIIEQIELTESILNDLKSVNEGIELKYTPFKVGDLFSTWSKTPRLHNASITLDIQNNDSQFSGDFIKIKGFFGELVENAIKLNRDRELEIRLAARDVTVDSCELFRMTRGRSDKKYLQLTVSDNGRGIPAGRKEWIFMPLTTTSGSSGLGLFIIRKTLRAMGGFIVEKGLNGAYFEICIPYITPKRPL